VLSRTKKIKIHSTKCQKKKMPKTSTTLILIIALAGLSACGGDQVLSNNQQPDPVVVDVPLAFVKRTLPLDEELQLISQDLRQPSDFIPGAALYLKVRASASALETNISDRAFFSEEQLAAVSEENPLPQYDVKDLAVSYDGQRLIFAMRAPEIEDADDDEQPSWNIWQYDRQSDELMRVISSANQAEVGQDTAPVYLPDGRIVFSSTRQQANQAILLDEGKPQYQALEEGRDQAASVLHVMSADGGDIQQLSFNQSHDLDPTILSNGKILFSRWDQAGNNNSINLYQMNSDGSQLEIAYGRHSHNSERSPEALQFTQPRELPSGEILTALRPFESDQWGGDYVSIDITTFIDNEQAVAAQAGNTGPAQLPALFDNIVIDGALSPGGQFASVFPLWDGSERILFSWSQCRVFDPEQVVDENLEAQQERTILPCSDELLANELVEAAPLLYGLWMFDPMENTQLPVAVAQEGQLYAEVVAMQARSFPADASIAEDFDGDLANKDLGQVHIRSVYDFAGVDTSPQGIASLADPTQTPVVQRPARFLRIVKAVSLPDEDVRDFDNSAFGRSNNQLMREIIGYVPIEPDGSVMFQVPAKVPLAFSVLDVNGKRLGERHQNWLQFAPGEVRQCSGCHSQSSTLPHGKMDAEAESINQGATATGVPFPNTNPALFADMGETMAQTTGRILGVSYPGTDIVFSDIWSDPQIQLPAADFIYAYGELQTPLPITTSCAINWTSLCRIQIHYPVSIQPMFDLARQEFADDGVTLLQDQTCTSCHSPVGADELAQVPAGQLDLSGTPSTDNADFLTGYRELMFGDNQQEIIEGALLDRLVIVTDGDGNTVFETDEEGELMLDAEGQPIAVTQTVGVANSMSTNGARASNRFFSPFETGGSHVGWLTPAERKLLAEWLDIGGQYYNNPFVAPAD
jgi:hypothetical protein